MDRQHIGSRRELLLGAALVSTVGFTSNVGNASEIGMPAISRKSITVSDGVTLSYLEAGSGPVLVLIPGWSQTADQYKYQIQGLSSIYRVLAIDLRGHGESEKPAFGYRIQRLAKDIEDTLVKLDLKDVIILGHSMGCSVLWCHFDLFGPDRIRKYVFCDQASFLTTNPKWTAQEIANYGSIFTPSSVVETCNKLIGPNGADVSESFLRSMVTSAISTEQFRWILNLNLKLPRQYAADLLYNHCFQDWRDVLPRISRPSLFIGGESSLVPVSCMRWNASQALNSSIEIFEASDRGSHFMFIENHKKFNAILASLI